MDENTAPEDFEYARGVAKDVKAWLLERYQDKKIATFKLPDCKEKFMKISERFLVMACQQLVEERFLFSDESSRLPQFSIFQGQLPELKTSEGTAEKRAVKRKVRKKINYAEDTSVGQESHDESEDESNDEESEEVPETSPPKKVRKGEPGSPTKVIVHEVIISSSSRKPLFSSSDDRLQSVMTLANNMHEEFGDSFSFATYAERAQKEYDIDLETLTALTTELEEQNKIMRYEDLIIII